MKFNMGSLIYILDIFGTVSFAIAASLMAYKKNLDPFGILVISIVTAIGGGTLRDILLQNYPIFWIRDIVYLVLIIISSMIAQVFYSRLLRIADILLFFDAIGIGVFTIIGIRASLGFNLNPLICILMGTTTAVFGGMIRDVLCNEIPVILQKELYATLCIFGGALFFIFKYCGVPLGLNYTLSILVIIVTRIIAIKFNLSLPSITSD